MEGYCTVLCGMTSCAVSDKICMTTSIYTSILSSSPNYLSSPLFYPTPPSYLTPYFIHFTLLSPTFLSSFLSSFLPSSVPFFNPPRHRYYPRLQCVLHCDTPLTSSPSLSHYLITSLSSLQPSHPPPNTVLPLSYLYHIQEPDLHLHPL